MFCFNGIRINTSQKLGGVEKQVEKLSKHQHGVSVFFQLKFLHRPLSDIHIFECCFMIHTDHVLPIFHIDPKSMDHIYNESCWNKEHPSY